MQSINFGFTYDRIQPGVILPGVHRWIGRCKKCGATHQVAGELVNAWAPEQKYTKGTLTGSTRSARSDYVVKSTDGLIYTMNGGGGDVSKLPVPCNDHWAFLRRVTEGTKKSKHECGARCTSATGPNCDCRCRGKNHGSNC